MPNLHLSEYDQHPLFCHQHPEAVLNDKYIELLSQEKCFSFSCVCFSFINKMME